MSWLRRGGRGIGPDGSVVLWSVATGRRGARWREVITFPDGTIQVLLLETTTAGRPSRLEVSSTAGLLTAHPASDASALHGNVVTPGGIHHLTLTWTEAHQLLVIRSPISRAVLVGAIDRTLDETPCVIVGDDLRPTIGQARVAHHGSGRWDLVLPPDERRFAVAVDSDGLPVLDEGRTWELET
jgi:hypothetical protein